MTNEEAINILNILKKYYNDEGEYGYEGFDANDNEALDMAIQALEQTELNSSYNSVKPELKPCGDCISRTDALNAFKPKGISEELWMESNTYKVLMKLSPVIPKAEWIPCSERLPEIVEWYLTSFKWGDGTEGVMISWFDGMSFKAEVTAWMPLPSSYQCK